MKLLSLLFTTAALAYQVEIHPEYQQGLAINDVPAERRLHWMRVANEAVYADGHPCPQAPFGTAIVNTTSDELVCVISNKVGVTGSKFLFFFFLRIFWDVSKSKCSVCSGRSFYLILQTQQCMEKSLRLHTVLKC